MIAARNAKVREGTEELKRVEGQPPSGVMSMATFNALSLDEQAAMTPAERRKIYEAARAG